MKHLFKGTTRKSDVANLNLTLDELKIIAMAINAEREKGYSSGTLSPNTPEANHLNKLQKRFLNLASRLKARIANGQGTEGGSNELPRAEAQGA